MSSISTLFEQLGLVDCAVLKYEKEQDFTVIYAPHTWFFWFFPDASASDTLTITSNNAYIENFLPDAKQFWSSPSGTQLSSGIWREKRFNKSGMPKEFCLECIAASAEGQHFLIINNAQSQFDQKQQTLQVAREVLLSHDKMQAEHDYLSQKLQTIIKRNETVLDLHLPVEQAISNADIGVVIVDKKHHVLFLNASAYSCFELDMGEDGPSPFSIVQQLLEGQYPEATDLLTSAQSWNGELYWQSPPNYRKWLQVSIRPVVSGANQVSHRIITITDATRVKHLLQKNEDLALKDALTGVSNRQYMWSLLDAQTKSSFPISLLFIDILKFKSINELYGHATGDKVLKDIATRLNSFTDQECHVCRVGSARFAIVYLPPKEADYGEQRALARNLAENILKKLTVPFLTDKKVTCHIETAIGIAIYPQDTQDSETLIKAANMALADNKIHRDGSISFYSRALRDAQAQKLKMEVKLKNALENEEFRVYLQPILDMESERIVKAEALLRWRTPEGEEILPDVFIPIAEQTGLIVPLGNWVIKQVCQLLTFLREKRIDIKLAVNISPKQVSNRYLLDFIKSTALRAGVDAQRLELELTEGVLIDDYEKASSLLNSLRDMGVSIAIDDFGTGYSSLSNLKHLPIDHLKIDRSFIRELDMNEDDRAITLAIIAMAKQLKLSVIAEGVETGEQKAFLKEHECQAIQGYLFSKPIPADEFVRLYRKQHPI